MDTRTRTESPAADDGPIKHTTPPPVEDKISAYYSLVFPHFTFYIQTLSITIGRRCAPNAASSSSAPSQQVDVDLGALKSVSRLHAKIEYDQDEDRFVLVVIGRNGAWVDGVWSGTGTRAPLGERSQIQIASRTFHFVLPPPPPPEDTPSPSSQSSTNRRRSPSVDVTSIDVTSLSPPSSQPSHSPPPPVEVKLQPPSPEPLPSPKSKPKPQIPAPIPVFQPTLPNSNSIGQSSKANSKKRKKGDVEPAPVLERPKPEDMPPKPNYTYAQLIYRAIRELGGKGTLQQICTWIMNTYEYYRYADSTAWMSSVRHNLSSNRAFNKMERCGGDKGKGFYWSLDVIHSQTLEEQEQKAKQAAIAAATAIAQGTSTSGIIDPGNKSRKEKRNALLEPPLKRSVKGDLKGMPLPPPLTSSPLPFKTQTPAISLPSTSSLTTSTTATTSISQAQPSKTTTAAATTGVFAYPSHPQNVQTMNVSQQTPAMTQAFQNKPLTGTNPYAPLVQPNWAVHANAARPSPSTPVAAPPSSTSTPSVTSPPPLPAGQAVVPDVVIPIILGPIPPTHPDYSSNHPNNSAKEGYMILHERKLILDPDIFAELTKEMLEKLEAMGARAALQVLTEHMIRALKERRARERGKERGVRRPKGAGRGGARKPGPPATAPFTNMPLERRKPLSSDTSAVGTSPQAVNNNAHPHFPPSQPPVPSALPLDEKAVTVANESNPPPGDPGSPLIVVDDISEDEGPAAKKRKLDGGEGLPT